MGRRPRRDGTGPTSCGSGPREDVIYGGAWYRCGSSPPGPAGADSMVGGWG